MGYIAAIGSLLSTGANMYGQSQQASNSTKGRLSFGQAEKQLKKLDLGSKPDAAEYVPVDFNKEQMNAVLANSELLPDIRNLTSQTNQFITSDSLRQANRLIPGYTASMSRLGTQANDLVNARLPDDVVQSLVSDRAEKNNGVNIPGLAGNATLKDLGMSSLDAINQGTGLLGKMSSIADSMSPQSRYMTPQGFYQQPEQRIQDTMGQHAVEQQSLQNKYNLAASADPTDMAIAQLVTGSALLGGNRGYAPNYGSSISQGLNQIGGIGRQNGWWGPTSGGNGSIYGQNVPNASWTSGYNSMS